MRRATSGLFAFLGFLVVLTAARTVGPDAFIGHVGDSRVYLFRGGSLQQLTRDHTLAQQLVDAGAIPSVSAASRYMQNMLVNCLGARKREVHVEVHHLGLSDGDRLLLCTDGLTDLVADDQIAQILARDAAPDDTCRALVDAALDRGGKDNVTVVLAKYTIPKTLEPQR